MQHMKRTGSCLFLRSIPPSNTFKWWCPNLPKSCAKVGTCHQVDGEGVYSHQEKVEFLEPCLTSLSLA